MEKLVLPANKRSRFVGLGGINLRRLEMETGVQITQDEDGGFQMFAPNRTAMEEAQEMVQALTASDAEPVLEFGAVYTAKVFETFPRIYLIYPFMDLQIVEIRDIGVMVTLYSNMIPVLVHNSQLDQRKVC